jgi:hypothetical protein
MQLILSVKVCLYFFVTNCKDGTAVIVSGMVKDLDEFLGDTGNVESDVGLRENVALDRHLGG